MRKGVLFLLLHCVYVGIKESLSGMHIDVEKYAILDTNQTSYDFHIRIWRFKIIVKDIGTIGLRTYGSVYCVCMEV